MIDIHYDNFETELIGASMQTPVLLDIWAPWCGPCKQLGPVLEQLEVDYGGRFILAKLNADEVSEIASQLSQMFGVRSIPFCVMFVQGQPVDGFVGAMPQTQIQEFLDKHVPAGSADAAPNNEPDALPPASTDPVQQLLLALSTDPGNDELRFDAIKALINQGDVTQAQAVFAPVEPRAAGPLPDPRVVAFGHYIAAAHTATSGRSIEALQAVIAANKRDFSARYELAQCHFGVGEFTAAMDELLEIIMRDKAWENELARKTYVSVLEVMSKPVPKPSAKEAPRPPGSPSEPPKLALAGHAQIAPNDPVIDQYRRKLSMALF